jgi:hypothetical protein
MARESPIGRSQHSVCQVRIFDARHRGMEYLTEKRAREAVVRASSQRFIVPPAGVRVNDGTIDFILIRRNDYEELTYRTRLSEDGVLLGHWVGSAVISNAEEVAP